jgi:hypothetical protein
MGIQILISFQLKHAIGLGMMSWQLSFCWRRLPFHRLAFAGRNPIVHKMAPIFA